MIETLRTPWRERLDGAQGERGMTQQDDVEIFMENVRVAVGVALLPFGDSRGTIPSKDFLPLVYSMTNVIASLCAMHTVEVVGFDVEKLSKRLAEQLVKATAHMIPQVEAALATPNKPGH